MPRFNKQNIQAKEIIKNLHKAIYYQDLEAIMKLWIDEEQISYIDINGNAYKTISNIEKIFSKMINTIVNIEILHINIQNMIGSLLVETLEVFKYSEKNIKYVYATYILVPSSLGWKLARLHLSIANPSDISYIDCSENLFTILH